MPDYNFELMVRSEIDARVNAPQALASASIATTTTEVAASKHQKVHTKEHIRLTTMSIQRALYRLMKHTLRAVLSIATQKVKAVNRGMLFSSAPTPMPS